jgi:hypothetical protein
MRAARPYRWQELADYNGRVGHGVVHTPEYKARMRLEQAAFDEEMAVRSQAERIRWAEETKLRQNSRARALLWRLRQVLR